MSGRLIQFAASLYPAWWRARYGPEFAALLEDVNPGARTFVNILKGALLMQFNRLDLARAAAACLLVGVIAAGAALFATPRHFASSLSIEVQATDDAAWPETAAPEALGFNDTNLTQVIDTLGLYRGERGNLTDAEVLNQFRRDISVQRSVPAAGEERADAQATGDAAVFRDRGLLTLSFAHPDGPTAEKVVTALGQIIVVENVRRAEANRAAQPDRGAGVRVRIARPARHDKADPNLVAVMGAGLGAAALAAAGIFVMRRRTQPGR